MRLCKCNVALTDSLRRMYSRVTEVIARAVSNAGNQGTSAGTDSSTNSNSRCTLCIGLWGTCWTGEIQDSQKYPPGGNENKMKMKMTAGLALIPSASTKSGGIKSISTPLCYPAGAAYVLHTTSVQRRKVGCSAPRMEFCFSVLPSPQLYFSD